MPNDFCEAVDCLIQASYGEPGKRSQFCRTHAPLHFTCRNKVCESAGCTTFATFGPRGGKRTYCATHAPNNHISIGNAYCQYEGCSTQACFGLVKGRPIYCGTHAPPEYSDVVSKLCAEDGCNIRPHYGPLGGSPMYCRTHADPSHIDLTNRMCAYPGCVKTQPTYGRPGGKGVYCRTHAPDDYIMVKTVRRCIYPNCELHPIFGPRGGKPETCKTHIKKGYINVISKTCANVACDTRPTYGLVQRKPVYCQNHTPLNAGYRDVMNKMCNGTGCTSRAYYGKLFQPKIHCRDHKTVDEYTNNNPKCKKCKKERPLYTDQENNFPLRCDACKLDADVNVVERKCDTCKLPSFIRSDFQDCEDCYAWWTVKPQKSKEVMVKAILDTANVEYTSHDKIPKDSCFRYRPDFMIDCGTHVLIVEVDEDQHRGYDCTCEQARMINLFQDQGGMHTIFIRFNPDTYTDSHGERHAWLPSRGKTLVDTIKKLSRNVPDKLVSAVYLYYDGYDGKSLDIHELDIDKLVVNISRS